MLPLGSPLVGRLLTPPAGLRRGRPLQYAERPLLKALIVMILRHVHRPGRLLAVFEEPTAEMLEGVPC